MRLTRLLFLLPALAGLGCLDAMAAGVKIISNVSVNAATVSVVELKSVFLQEKNTLRDGSRVVAVLQKKGATHEAFLSDYLQLSDEELQKYYRSMTFTGTGSMPKSVGSDNEVVAYVAKTRGAVGYVSVETDTHSVKTLTVIRVENGPERSLVARVDPEYPPDLNDRRIGGMVRLKVTVSVTGVVEDVQLIGGNPILAEAATRAVQKWRYASSRERSMLELSIPFDPHD